MDKLRSPERQPKWAIRPEVLVPISSSVSSSAPLSGFDLHRALFCSSLSPILLATDDVSPEGRTGDSSAPIITFVRLRELLHLLVRNRFDIDWARLCRLPIECAHEGQQYLFRSSHSS